EIQDGLRQDSRRGEFRGRKSRIRLPVADVDQFVGLIRLLSIEPSLLLVERDQEPKLLGGGLTGGELAESEPDSSVGCRRALLQRPLSKRPRGLDELRVVEKHQRLHRRAGRL